MEYDPWTEKSNTEVVVVSGAPLTGKTSYVRSKARPGELIVDVDWLFAALFGEQLYRKTESLLPFVASARDAIYERLMRKSEVERGWIITSNPDAALQVVRRLRAKHIPMPPISNEERHRRNEQRKTGNLWPGFLSL